MSAQLTVTAGSPAAPPIVHWPGRTFAKITPARIRIASAIANSPAAIDLMPPLSRRASIQRLYTAPTLTAPGAPT